MTHVIGIKMSEGIAVVCDTLITYTLNRFAKKHKKKVFSQNFSNFQYILRYSGDTLMFEQFADRLRNGIKKHLRIGWKGKNFSIRDILDVCEKYFEEINNRYPHFDLLFGIRKDKTINIYKLRIDHYDNCLREEHIDSFNVRVIGEEESMTQHIFAIWPIKNLGDAIKIAIFCIFFNQVFIQSIGIKNRALPTIEVLPNKGELNRKKLQKDKKDIMKICTTFVKNFDLSIKNMRI